jgi:hypothetical protein
VPQVTIYLDRELHQQVQQLDDSISRICQQALRRAVGRQELRGHPRHQIGRGDTNNPQEATWPTKHRQT